MTLDAKQRALARQTAANAITAGKLIRQPCEVCNEPAQMHHDDYTKPFDVRWFCRLHHLALHGIEPKVQVQRVKNPAAVLLGQSKSAKKAASSRKNGLKSKGWNWHQNAVPARVEGE